MRITGDPSDEDYVGERVLAVLLDDRFFLGGPVLIADTQAGEIRYYAVDENGNYLMDQATGEWRVSIATGKVAILEIGRMC